VSGYRCGFQSSLLRGSESETAPVVTDSNALFCRAVLRRNPHQHPLLYLKGVKYADLESVLNFMYHGEVNVAQDDLNSFLAVAEELKVKGRVPHSDVIRVRMDQ